MIRLVRINAQLSELADRPADLATALGAELGPVAELLSGVIAQSAAHHGIEPPEDWGGFVVIDAGAEEVVGMCAFVHPPDADGQIEIAYFTFPPFEGRGIATQMVAALIEHARRAGGVRTVYAHTLPHVNASTKVLGRHGFVQSGIAIDHEEGEVWRWERPLDPSPS